jgi:hypothetical protein
MSHFASEIGLLVSGPNGSVVAGRCFSISTPAALVKILLGPSGFYRIILSTLTGWWFRPLWKIWVRQLGYYSQYMRSVSKIRNSQFGTAVKGLRHQDFIHKMAVFLEGFTLMSRQTHRENHDVFSAATKPHMSLLNVQKSSSCW